MTSSCPRSRLEAALTRRLVRSRYVRVETGGVIVGETTDGRRTIIWLPDDAAQSPLVIGERAVRLPQGGVEAIVEWVREQPWATGKC